MSESKMPVTGEMRMSDLKLGAKIVGTAQRDAIHIAVLPCVLGEDYLSPGEPVRFLAGSTDTIISARYGAAGFGIVDPFLTDYGLKKGDKVWVYLTPNTVTGLRHHWEHPAIDNLRKMSDSELELRQWCDRLSFDFDNVVDAGKELKKTDKDASEWGPYITRQGRDLHSASELGEEEAEFWKLLEAYLKLKFTADEKEKVGWSCSC